MADKSVSIPERAREIAAKYGVKPKEIAWLNRICSPSCALRTRAMRKELEKMATNNLPNSVTKYGVLRDAAKLLREGGQK